MPQGQSHAYEPVQPDTIGRLRLLRANGVDMDIDGRQVRVDGVRIALPPKEFDLLRILVTNAGRVLSREQLLAAVWGPGYPDDNKTLSVHIQRLRKKIEASRENPARIRTIRGLGYVFDLEAW